MGEVKFKKVALIAAVLFVVCFLLIYANQVMKIHVFKGSHLCAAAEMGAYARCNEKGLGDEICNDISRAGQRACMEEDAKN